MQVKKNNFRDQSNSNAYQISLENIDSYASRPSSIKDMNLHSDRLSIHSHASSMGRKKSVTKISSVKLQKINLPEQIQIEFDVGPQLVHLDDLKDIEIDNLREEFKRKKEHDL